MNSNFKALRLAVLSAIVILFIFKQHALGCLGGTSCPATCDSWTCVSKGAITNPGKLSKTNETICVGGSVSEPVLSGTAFSYGKEAQWCTNNCNSSWTNYGNISYTITSWWVPQNPASASFYSVGTYYFTNYVIGHPLDWTCPDAIGPATVGTYTVTVVDDTSPPYIVKQPSSRTVAVGNNALFGVSATSCSGIIYYQWRKNGINLFNVGNISGVNSSMLLIRQVSLSDLGTLLRCHCKQLSGFCNERCRQVVGLPARF